MAKIDRRDFLVGGAAGTATIALPGLMVGCGSQSAQTEPTVPQKRVEDTLPNPTSFRVVLVTDSHVRLENEDPQNIYPSDKFANDKNRHVVKQINKLKPDLVIHLGDIPHTIPDSENHEQAMLNAHEIYKAGIEADLYIAAGNHDVGDKQDAYAASPVVSEKGHEVFEKYWGKSYSSFDYKDCHFVLINSPVLNSGLPIEKKQQTWLENDLATNKAKGKRIFLCMHFPLYLNNISEGSHYDNVGEPARSWLLALLEKYDVEAVFSGHTHNFFYNLYKNTDLYVLPSITFVRPDFSAMFHIEPEAEYGRADTNKLGFCLLEIKQRGHKLKTIRTYGLTEEKTDTVVSEPVSLAKETDMSKDSPLGASLRHSWARTYEMPFDSLDEFTRKPIRNDYLLQALFELDINKLRVPTSDFTNQETLERIYVFNRLGCEFTVFTVGIPTAAVKDTVKAHKDIIKNLEIVVPRKQIKNVIPHLQKIKATTDISIYLSVIDILADQKTDPDFVFSHFPKHGFKLKETELLATCIDKYKADRGIHGFVFRVDQKMNTWESINKAGQIAENLNMEAIVHLKMPRINEGDSFKDDGTNANILSEALIASMSAKNVNVILDTLVDHDRGYFPRHGLMDRRYNPRLPYHVLRHLHRAIRGDNDNLKISQVKTSPAASVKAFDIQSPEFRCALVLPDKVDGLIKLEFDTKAGLKKSPSKSLDLHTGRLKDLKATVLGDNKTALEINSTSSDPFLVVLQ